MVVAEALNYLRRAEPPPRGDDGKKLGELFDQMLVEERA